MFWIVVHLQSYYVSNFIWHILFNYWLFNLQYKIVYIQNVFLALKVKQRIRKKRKCCLLFSNYNLKQEGPSGPRSLTWEKGTSHSGAIYRGPLM